MATFTITTSQNIDELASKAGSDTYTINGGYLTIDQHTRYGLNQNTSACMGNITLSATLGGTCHFDGRYVRLIPFSGGSGTLPALNSLVTQGSASGKLVGVYSALTSAPTVSGTIPASGWIMIKQWNSVEYTSGALTLSGITASATGPSIVGWLEIVGVDSLTTTVNRLNTFKVTGAYFDLGTTSGVNTTTYQIPSNGSLVYLPGVQVETGTGTGVYEWYPCAGSRTALAASVATDDTRGKVCWISTAGLLRFKHDGTNSTGGYLPPSGRKIRIPNVFLMTGTTTYTANVIPSTTLTTRMEFATSGGGAIDIDKCCCNWYLNLQQPFSVSITNTGIMSALLLQEVAAPLTISSCCIGQEAAVTQNSLTMTTCLAGGTISDLYVTRAALGATGLYIFTATDLDGFTFSNLRLMSLTPRAHATTGCATHTRVVNTTFTNTYLIGGRYLGATLSNVSFNNTKYCDNNVGFCNITYRQDAFNLTTVCSDIKIDGLELPTILNQPFVNLVTLSAACKNIKIRNFGTPTAPLDLGGPQMNCTWTRSSTTATVTTPSAHNLVTGMYVYVLICNDTAAIVIGSKLITVTTTTAFTFTCLNAGATSGTCTLYATNSTYPVICGTSAQHNNIRMQRIYTIHARTGITTSDNGNKNILMESVWADYPLGYTFAQLNGTSKNLMGTFAFTASTAVYGTIWLDCFIGPPSTVTSGSWARKTTVATVTANDHNLRTGVTITVTVTSDSSAIILGVKTVTCLTQNTFTFTCLNAGAASGTITYQVHTGRVGILGNESTVETLDQYTIDVGTPKFTSAGTVVMGTLNDQITWTSPHFIKCHTSFPILEAVMGGGTIANYELKYALDKGSGFGSFRNLYYTRAGGAGTSGQYTVTVTDATGVEVDDYVWGTNVGYNAKVTQVNGNTITLNIANIGTVSGILRFNHLPSESGITATTGFKMKIRLKTTTASSTGISSVYVVTDSSVTDRQSQYPLDTIVLTVNGLVAGSDVVVRATGTETVRDSTDSVGGTSWGYTYETPENVDISIFKPGYIPAFIKNYALSSVNTSLPVVQMQDPSYIE